MGGIDVDVEAGGEAGGEGGDGHCFFLSFLFCFVFGFVCGLRKGEREVMMCMVRMNTRTTSNKNYFFLSSSSYLLVELHPGM